jgi:hypothetical protein
MTRTTDYTAMFKDMANTFPLDMTAMQDAFRTSAAYGEKLSKVALDAAGKSTEISVHWTRDTLARLGEVTRLKAEPADYAKSVSDFASAQAELVAENLAAFAEVAKTMQMQTVELLLAAGQTAGEQTAAAATKTSDARGAKAATAAR